MARILTIPAGRRAKFVVAAVFLARLRAVVGGLFAGKFEDAQKNETSSFLPGKAESVKALEAVKRYPGGELAPAVIVYRAQGRADRRRPAARRRQRPAIAQRRPARSSPCRRSSRCSRATATAALFVDPRSGSPATATRFQTRRWTRSATRVSGEHGGLTVKVTGAAGYRSTRSRSSATSTARCCCAAALIVLILLILIYRSPIFWAIPFFTVLLAESAARGVGYLLAEAGVTINGQSGGILPVLVFGAGTDYALLLVSALPRGAAPPRGQARGDAGRAPQRPGPAILASGLTVIAALLTLIARRGQRHRRPRPDRRDGRRARDDLDAHDAARAAGDLRAQGVLVAVLRHDPARRRRQGTDETHGFWRRIGERVAARPRRGLGRRRRVVLVLLAAQRRCRLDTGLTNGNSFRGEVESVAGPGLLARIFPAGASAPTERDRARPRRRRPRCARRCEQRRELVAQVRPAAAGPAGHAARRRAASRDPYSTAAFDQVPAAARASLKRGGRRERARRRPDRGGLRLPQVRGARQLRVIIPLALARRVPDPRAPAARRCSRRCCSSRR